MERKSMSRRIAFFVLVYLVSFTVTLAITRQRVTQNTTIEDLIEFMSSLSTRSPFSKLVQTTIPDFSSGYNSYPSKETQINMTIPGPSSGISTRPPKNTTSENNISFDSGFSYNISPLIKLVIWYPRNPPAGVPIDVYSEIIDTDTIVEVILSYYNGTTWINTTMTYNTTLGLYEGQIPPLPGDTNGSLKIYAKDEMELWTTSKEYNFTVLTQDTEKPVFINVTWNPREPFSNQSVDVTANITDNSGVEKAILEYYNGTQYLNITMEMDIRTGLFYATIPPLPEGTQVTFRMYAKDYSNNWATSHDYTYTVLDITPPEIIDVFWTPSEPAEGEIVTVYVNITDNVNVSLAILSYSTDGISWTNVSMSYNFSIDLWVGSIPGMSALTEVRFKIYANDTSGNWGVSDEYSYTVRDLTPPTIEISSPVNDSYLAKSVIVVEWSASDNCGIDHYEVYVDGSPVNTSISSGVTSYTLSMSEGDHNITVVAVDLAGNTASDSIVIHVDLTSPTMEITSPEDGSYIAESIVTVKWSSSDNYGINHYEVYVDGSPVNTSIPADVISYMLNLSEGDHNITVLAFDLAGNMAFDSVVIHIDLHGPEFIRVWWIPEEPEEGASVTVYANITDMSGVREAILSYYNGSAWVNVTMEYNSSSGLWFGTIPGLPAGNVTFKIYAVDNAGNMSISPEYSYTVKPKPTTTTTTTTTTTPKKGISPAIIALPLIIAIVAIVIVILRTKKKTTEEA